MEPIDALISAARSYLGVPFRHAGADRHGVDCVGLVLAAARESGLFAHTPQPYSRGDTSRLVAEIERFAFAVDETPRPGDLLLIRVRDEETHVALVSDRGTIIHAAEKVGRVVEQRLTVQVMAQVSAVFRWRGEPSRP